MGKLSSAMTMHGLTVKRTAGEVAGDFTKKLHSEAPAGEDD
jgi:hypothetical protein